MMKVMKLMIMMLTIIMVMMMVKVKMTMKVYDNGHMRREMAIVENAY